MTTMLYNCLGDTGLVVSRLAFGAMTFGTAEGAYASIFKVGQDLANELVACSLDRGVNFFNTADAYANGDSETMLGRALGARRQDAVIATKVGMRTGEPLLRSGLSRRYVLNAAEDSLRRLGTDYIDVYLAHRPDPHTPLEETVDAFDLLVRQGKVRYVGFSNWPAWQAAKAIGLQKTSGAAPFCAAEMYYSLVGRDLEHEILPFARDAGVGIMVWSPLAGGFLSGKYTRADPTGGGGRLTGFDFIRSIVNAATISSKCCARSRATSRVSHRPRSRWRGCCTSRRWPRCSWAPAARRNSTTTSRLRRCRFPPRTWSSWMD
jgi:aryl-alcohol dehydrogenase-like predicted oxidoreductase